MAQAMGGPGARYSMTAASTPASGFARKHPSRALVGHRGPDGRVRGGRRHRQGLVVGIGAAVFVAGVLTTTGWVLLRAIRSAQPRNDLLRPGGVVAILGVVAVTVGVSLAVAFILKASGVSRAATIGVSVAAVMLVVGGPMLMRHLRGLMLANRSGCRR
jgi:hypothetical protein